MQGRDTSATKETSEQSSDPGPHDCTMCLRHVVPQCHAKPFIPSKTQEIWNKDRELSAVPSPERHLWATETLLWQFGNPTVRNSFISSWNSEAEIVTSRSCFSGIQILKPSELLWSQILFRYNSQRLHFTSTFLISRIQELLSHPGWRQKQPLTHPEIIHDLDRLLELNRDVHRDVVVETGTHWETLRQGRPVVFPPWNGRELPWSWDGSGPWTIPACAVDRSPPDALSVCISLSRRSSSAAFFSSSSCLFSSSAAPCGCSCARSQTGVSTPVKAQQARQSMRASPLPASTWESPLWASWWRAARWRRAPRFWASANKRELIQTLIVTEQKDIKIQSIERHATGRRIISPFGHPWTDYTPPAPEESPAVPVSPTDPVKTFKKTKQTPNSPLSAASVYLGLEYYWNATVLMSFTKTAEEIPLAWFQCETLHYCVEAKPQPSLFKL